MTKKKDLKRRVRERAKKTGESYTAARKRVLEARESPDARETLEARETPDASPAQPARGQTASGAAQPEPMAPAQEQITPSPLWAGPLASKTVNLPPEVVARRQQMIVDLSFDISAIPPELREGEILGLRCPVIPNLELHQSGLARRALEGFKAALEALAGDPAAVILRGLAFEGVGPPLTGLERSLPDSALAVQRARYFPMDAWRFSREGFPAALAMVKRLEAGLVGLGPDGRSLAFQVEGQIVIAYCATRGTEKVIALQSKATWLSHITALQRAFGPRKP